LCRARAGIFGAPSSGSVGAVAEVRSAYSTERRASAADAAVPPLQHQKSPCWVRRKCPLLLCTAHHFNALLVVRDASPRTRSEGVPEGAPGARVTSARALHRTTAACPVRGRDVQCPLSMLRTKGRREGPAVRTFRLILIAKRPRRNPLEPGRPTRRAVSQHALSQLLKVVRDPHQRRRIARRGAAGDLGRFRKILRLHETSEKRASHSHTANGCRYLGATSAVRKARDN
jgi:hypothetical protein